MPLTDNHMHLDPLKGYGLAAVRKFQRSGGRRLFLVCKTTSDWEIPLRGVESFRELYQRTIRLAREVKEKTGVTAFPVIGVHPAEVVRMCRELSVEKATNIANKALDLAGELIVASEATAIGEVGRPHFRVSGRVANACEEVLRHAFEVAYDAGCALQIHAAGGEGLFSELRSYALKAKVKPERVIKHFSSPEINAAAKAGVYPSVIATRGNVVKAIEEGSRFMMESDYIDDLRRPGAVVGPRSVPRLSMKLLEEGVLSEEELWRIHVDNVEKAYGI